MNNRMWIVHRPTGARVLLGTQDGRLWHMRSDNDTQREFDEFADKIDMHARQRGNECTDCDLALELADASRSPWCFGVNEGSKA